MKPSEKEISTFVPSNQQIHSDTATFNAAGLIKKASKKSAHTLHKRPHAVNHRVKPIPKSLVNKVTAPKNLPTDFPTTGTVIKKNVGNYSIGDKINYRFNPDGFNKKGSYEFLNKGTNSLVGVAKRRFEHSVEPVLQADNGSFNDAGQSKTKETSATSPATVITKTVQSPGSYTYIKIGLPVATGLTGFGIAYSIKNQLGISITIGFFSALAGLGVAYAIQPRSSGVATGDTSKSDSTAGTGTSIQQMKYALVAENVKDGLSKEATEAYVNKLTTKEIQSLYLTIKMPNKDVLSKRFPELYKTPVKSEAEGYKLMGALAEKIQGDYGISGLTAQEFITNSESAVKKMFA